VQAGSVCRGNTDLIRRCKSHPTISSPSYRTVGDMATFEELDGLLAEALQCLNDAAGLVRELTQLETKPSLLLLG
jgi:hypothetical protein